MEKTLEERLLQFQTEIGIIKKDSKNPHFKNTYASLEQILSEVKPILTKCGLILLQPINDKGVCTMLTMVGGSETDFVESYIPLPTGLAPQPLGSAITYFRRYTLSSLLSLEIDDDDASMASKPIVVKELTLAEKIEDAKATLIIATALNFGSLWKTLSPEMQANEEVLKLGKELKTKLKI
jgi:ERF superfamily